MDGCTKTSGFQISNREQFELARPVVGGARSSRIGLAGEVAGPSRRVGGLEKIASPSADEAFVAHDQLFDPR